MSQLKRHPEGTRQSRTVTSLPEIHSHAEMGTIGYVIIAVMVVLLLPVLPLLIVWWIVYA